MKTARPSDLELQVLSVLWEIGPATVRQLRQAMPDGKKRAYTTVLSVLQVMEKKRLVTHDRQGMTHVYRPTGRQRQVLGPLLRELTNSVFGGSPARVLQLLLARAQLDDEELAEIRRLIRGLDAGKGPANRGG